VAYQNHIIVGIGGQHWIQLFDQDTFGAIVDARTAFGELDVAEVFYRRRVVDGDVRRSRGRATLLSVTLAVMVTRLDCGRLRSASLKETELELY